MSVLEGLDPKQYSLISIRIICTMELVVNCTHCIVLTININQSDL